MTSTGQSAGRATDPGEDSIVVLFKGGRLPAWHHLSQPVQDAYSQEHVDLMLSVSRHFRLMHLEGFRLLGPQNNWQRFWVIEFPSLAGTEAWVQAEMAPPYGSYGHYEYHLARRVGGDDFTDWVTHPPVPVSPAAGDDPHRIPTPADRPRQHGGAHIPALAARRRRAFG